MQPRSNALTPNTDLHAMLRTVGRPHRVIGRFAPSPTGPLHQGSLVAALASWLDARARGGQWLLRIDDLDPPREVPGAAGWILDALIRHGLRWDGDITWQSRRMAAYQTAFARLQEQARIYPCGCTRREIDLAVLADRGALPRHVETPYPRLCRTGLAAGKQPRAWRLKTDASQTIGFADAQAGWYQQDVGAELGDFVIKRADGVWAYHLACVVDDAHAGITDIVRGDDLLSSTPRQILLQQMLGMPTPRYRHIPVLRDDRGDKLSKQTLAPALDAAQAARSLDMALQHLGLGSTGLPTVEQILAEGTRRWARAHLKADCL